MHYLVGAGRLLKEAYSRPSKHYCYDQIPLREPGYRPGGKT